MPLKANDLGDLQVTVLRALWTLGEGTVYEVLDAIPRRPAPAYTTVLTALRSLEKRGLLEHRLPSGERQYRYRPLVDEAEAERSVLGDVIQRLFDGSPERLLARLLEITPLSREEIEGLHRMLDSLPSLPESGAAPEEPARKASLPHAENGAAPLNSHGSETSLASWRRTIARRLRQGARSEA